jgi:hypothetical protein
MQLNYCGAMAIGASFHLIGCDRMKLDELTKPLGLEEKHFKIETTSLPIIDSSIYTTFGRRLYELYNKYKISSEDQREIERLGFLLVSFTLERPKQNFFCRLMNLFRN